MSETGQNLPSTRIQRNPTLCAEGEGMGRDCPPPALRVNGPSQAKVTDNTEKSVTENSPCVYFFGEFSQDGPASPPQHTLFCFLISQILIS